MGFRARLFIFIKKRIVTGMVVGCYSGHPVHISFSMAPYPPQESKDIGGFFLASFLRNK